MWLRFHNKLKFCFVRYEGDAIIPAHPHVSSPKRKRIREVGANENIDGSYPPSKRNRPVPQTSADNTNIHPLRKLKIVLNRSDVSKYLQNKENKENKEIRTKKQGQPKKTSRHSYDSNYSSDSEPEVVLSKITRKGPSIVRIMKRFEEIERHGDIDTDVNSIECIMACGRRKSTILLPCRHQHTCETCWYMWKIHQINKVPLDALNEDDEYDVLKPKCPMCKEIVDEAIAAFN